VASAQADKHTKRPSFEGGVGMSFIRNILAIIGLLTLVGGGIGYATVTSKLKDFDAGFVGVYQQFAERLLETGDPGVAMMWSVPVEEGLEPEDVIESLKSLANARNMLFVGESPFYKQVEAMTGEKYRYINFLSFCSAKIGKLMLEYKDQYSGFMPCRIAVVEDKAGNLFLFSMNLDLMIHGGRELPAELKEGALEVRKNIREMMEAAAAGEF
jgi:uncharacterized protein (DUF302 family)